VLGELRHQHPETVPLAEAYWDLEWEPQQQGFNFCYDKRLYDRIVSENASTVCDHLQAELGYQSRLLRFLENHDEPRIANRLPTDAEQAAAVAIATLPGATMWHEGQFEGRRVRPPVFLRRRPDEQADQELASWYQNLLALVAGHQVRAGEWQLLQVTGCGWAGPTCRAGYPVSPTSSAEAYSSGTAASWPAPGCSWPWSRGNSTCSPWNDTSRVCA
jgi:hypothetical protein